MRKFFEEFKWGWLFIFATLAALVWGLEVFWSIGGLESLFYPVPLRVFSYGLILLCFVTSLIYIDKCKDKILQSVALFFTCCADLFLVLLEGQHKTLAMLFFLCAQIVYALRTLGFAKSKGEKIVNISIRAFLSLAIALATLVLLWGDKDLPLFVISVVYYANLLVSILFSFIHCRKGAHILLTAIGLLLFSLCDITIGFDFLIDIFSLGQGNFIYDVMHLGINFVAVFYPPSQALLALSSFVKRK